MAAFLNDDPAAFSGENLKLHQTLHRATLQLLPVFSFGMPSNDGGGGLNTGSLIDVETFKITVGALQVTIFS